MAESPPKFEEEEKRRASQTAVDAGLTSEEDAAMLGTYDSSTQITTQSAILTHL